MKIENNIGWCDATINAVTGCDKVSPGCKNCYAEAGTRARVLRAQGKETWGAKGERVPVNFEPVFRRLNKLCVCDNCHTPHAFDWIPGTCAMNGKNVQPCNGKLRRIRLFADSNSDFLDPKWPIETLAKFLDAIRLAPNVCVQLLSKRIEFWRDRIIETADEVDCRKETDQQVALAVWLAEWLGGNPPSNVWLGVSVEDQKRADERIPLLLQTPAAVRFLSVEPLLEAVSLEAALYQKNVGLYVNKSPISWVIVGGESGKNRRDCGVVPIASVLDQCLAARVPCYVKQDSALLPGQQGRLSHFTWSHKEFPR